MKGFVVTTGEYDDYRIVTVCSTEEAAEHTVKFLNQGKLPSQERHAAFFELEVDKYTGKLPLGLFPYFAVVADDGTVKELAETTFTLEIDLDEPMRVYPGQEPNGRWRFGYSKHKTYLCTTVWARSKDLALEAVEARRIAWVANNKDKVVADGA